MNWLCGPGGCWHGTPLPWWAALGPPVVLIGGAIIWWAVVELDAWWTVRGLRSGIIKREKQKPHVMESHSHRQARPKAKVSTRRWPPAWVKR